MKSFNRQQKDYLDAIERRLIAKGALYPTGRKQVLYIGYNPLHKKTSVLTRPMGSNASNAQTHPIKLTTDSEDIEIERPYLSDTRVTPDLWYG